MSRTPPADPADGLTMVDDALKLMAQADQATASLLRVNRNHPLYVLSQSARTAQGRPVHLRRLLPMWAFTGQLKENPFLPWLDLVAALSELHGELTGTDLVDDNDLPENPDEAFALGIVPGGRVQQSTFLILAADRPVIAEIHRTRKSTEPGR